ncbi:MAG: pilus assembly protein TadB [Clostridiaceae bacterium]|nr:pilus assembly protein TadB [Clostridiaceae bacterium]
MTSFDSYTMSLKEKILYTAMAAVVIFAIAFIFYRSVLLSCLLVPLALFYPRIKTRDIIKKRKKELNIQFKDMLYSLSSSLSAGKTVESGFREALKDLSVLYPEPSAFILIEVRRIISMLETNETLEHALSDFASRARLEDVDNFVDVFNISKRSGGNISEVIKNTSAIISDRIEVAQEVDTMLAERRFEQKVLNVVPIFLILVLSASAPDYLSPVFNTAAGRLTMTASIGLLALSLLISTKLNDIKL